MTHEEEVKLKCLELAGGVLHEAKAAYEWVCGLQPTAKAPTLGRDYGDDPRAKPGDIFEDEHSI
jgi:hypothetical protein